MSKGLFLILGLACLSQGCRTPPPSSALQGEEAPSVGASPAGTPFTPQQIAVIKEWGSTREHRMIHYMWHAARNSWNEMTPEEQERIWFWQPPRPVIWSGDEYNREIDREATGKSGAGEDFLYMHHQMIVDVNADLVKQGLPKLEGWKRLPQPFDKVFPVKRADGVKSIKAFAKMLRKERQFTDRAYIAANYHTLSDFGLAVEFEIHNNMHMRWADKSFYTLYDIPERPEIQPGVYSGTGEKDDPWAYYNSPAYDYLGDSYSAHVNPLFYKIHGWVDDRIYDWLEAHGYKTISENCKGIPKCYQWQFKWVGPVEHAHHGGGVGTELTAEQLQKPGMRKRTLEQEAAIRKRLNERMHKRASMDLKTIQPGELEPDTKEEIEKAQNESGK